MSEKADEVPDHDTASFVGQRLSDGAAITSVSLSTAAACSAFFVSGTFFADVGVRVTPSWNVLSSPWILLGV
jgi:hypothetical protein